jgi:hypothetical protein
MMAPIVIPAACVFALLAIGSFAAVLNRVNRDRGGQRRRLEGLGRLCLPLGPLVGVGLAALAVRAGEVLPADVTYTYVLCTVMGGLAGFIAAVAFALFASASSP